MNQKKPKIEAIYPLSAMQQGMLFHSLYAPQSGVYFMQMAITIEGKLDKKAFKEAWQQVVARHAVLRTLFVWENREKPLQVVLKDVELPWSEQDWRVTKDKDPEQQLELYLAAERKQGFELDRAPLMRCTLMRVSAPRKRGEERYYFVWNSHHLLFDGWSHPLLLQEVWALYKSAYRGERLFLPRPRPYKDYMTWLGKQDLAQAEAYWRQALQGYTETTPLVVDRAVPNDHDQVIYSEHKFYLSSETSGALQKMARSNRLTVNTVIQGAWALLLSRYSHCEEVLFGTTVSGRPAELREVEKMIGLFINTLPVRVKVPNDVPLGAWLSDLQQQQREREQYAHSPLIDIQGWSEIPRGTPLFESLFVYENYPIAKENWKEGGGLQITEMRELGQNNYPLTLIAALVESDVSFSTTQDDAARLQLLMTYDTSRFEQEIIERMGSHLQTLLEGIVANPDQPVANLSLLSEAEKVKLLVEWNDNRADYPQRCIHELFEEAVERTPDAIAVVAGDQQLTYRELNARANQLAHYLIAQGVGPDVVVGICISRSAEMIVGLLGILKAGGAYLPLDPSLPLERTSFMIEDAQVKIILTEREQVETIPQAAQIVCLDADWPSKIAGQSSQNPTNTLAMALPENLAYIIFTSGSTGRPKGVAIEHRQLLNYVVGIQNALDLPIGASFATVSTLAADLGNTAIFPTLCTGGKLLVIPEAELSDPALFADYAQRYGLDCLKITPSHLTALMSGSSPADVLPRQLLVLGGEASSWKLINQIHSLVPACRIVNHYGPTETTIGVLTYPIKPGTTGLTSVPIGRPIANNQAYILDNKDRNHQPVPIGVPGELYIGGWQVARGYKGRPQLTKQRFISNPFSPPKVGGGWGGARLYKTGDLCRYLPDGNIEFLGRADYQVKIRGYRVELGEVEASLRQCVGVREALVIAREEAFGKRLVAYVTFDNNQVAKIKALKAQLSRTLPDYMIPSAFVLLEAMPLTPNGKIDRRALPAPELRNPTEQLVLPRTPVETTLATIWAEVLVLSEIGIHDNFFEIGGHSLLATQVVSRIRKQLHVEMPLPRLFRAPTIAELAEAIEKIKVSQAIQQSARDATTKREEMAI